jgi:molybdopterin-binding protein
MENLFSFLTKSTFVVAFVGSTLFTASADELLVGDVNSDGQVNISDSLAISSYISKYERNFTRFSAAFSNITLSEAKFLQTADYNQDDVVGPFDAYLIARASVRLPAIVLGDVNTNGKVETSDSLAIASYISIYGKDYEKFSAAFSNITLSEAEFLQTADYNQDELIGPIDSKLIAQASAGVSSSIYEDAEDGTTNKWSTGYGREKASIENVYDNDRESRVIEIFTSKWNYAWMTKAENNIKTSPIINWSMKTDLNTNVMISVLVETNNGIEKVEYILAPTQHKGKWKNYKKDIRSKLSKGSVLMGIREIKFHMSNVQSGQIGGSARFDNINF